MGMFKITVEYLPDAYSIIQNKLAIQSSVTEECIQSTDMDILEHTARNSIKKLLMVYETELDNLKYAPSRNPSMKSIYTDMYGYNDCPVNSTFYGASNA